MDNSSYNQISATRLHKQLDKTKQSTMGHLFFSRSGTSRSGTVIGNSACVFVCVHVCMYAAVAQLTEKMDAMYIIPKDQPEPGNDACII